MSSTVKYIEKETGVEVEVETVFAWEPHPMFSAVRYPSGRKYGLPTAELDKFFTIVTPQEIFLQAYGGIDDRPTPKQKEQG